MDNLILFHIDEMHFAFNILMVERVVNMVEVLPLPTSPNHIAGTINYQGEIIPVVNLRNLFLLPNRHFELADQLIVLKSAKMKMALWVDSTNDIVAFNKDKMITSENVYIKDELVEGLFVLNDERILLADPDKFLTNEQIEKLKILITEQRQSNKN
jgi:purine-binding chemotaxis protein CheW